MEQHIREVGLEIENLKTAGNPLEADDLNDDHLFALLSEGLPLLHSQALYIRNLECELQTLITKVKYFTELESRYKADLDELNYKCANLVPGFSGGDNLLSYSD